jgi:hypothetical protein
MIFWNYKQKMKNWKTPLHSAEPDSTHGPGTAGLAFSAWPVQPTV